MSSLLVRRRGKKAAKPAELPGPVDGATGTASPWAGGPDQPASPPSSGGGGDGDPPPQVVEWSNGPALATKAWGAVLALALLAGPAALVWTALRPEPAPVAAATGAASTTETAAASERAVELVETWLRADSNDQQLIASLTNAPVGSLPQEGLTIRDSSVAQVEPAEDGVWSVTVGVDVAEPAPGSTPAPSGQAKGEEAEIALVWVRRYFQVPVLVDRTDTKWSGPDLAVTALALPAPVPGPAADAEPPDLDYPETISPTSAAGQSVAGFLAAMVAGDGEITRYLRPGTSVSAVTPAPYSAVAVTGIKGSHEVTEDPADGDGTHALTTVELTRLDGQKTTAQYVLTLVARDGRWEVAGLEPAVRIDTTPSGTIDPGTAGE
ncbi:conjugative transposon protein TcpC [Promicromonospora sp. AC04]|uniref:conjugal transfer protein n=1 Tax=Promicromonospora sp. AC04 TaxID=2135723 RepID=UPI000D3D9FAE|nr:conjugal transfer protein [Promicromonospora sp. AC04]PUB28771.1 conjugative transposon protein TcpC [Promicromonospora sp. AC04]